LSTALAPDEILAAIELPLLPACPQTPTSRQRASPASR
jgi:hypothetical protein